MARTKFSQRRITFVCNPPEEKIVEQAEEAGYNLSEIMRELLRGWGKETFPPTPVYAQAMKEKVELKKREAAKTDEIENMSDEQYATEVLMGQVRPGGKVAFRIGGGREIYFDLATIKKYSAENNAEIDIHRQLVERTFTYFGKPLSDSQWEDIWDGWADHQPGWQQRQQEGLSDITKKPEKTPEEIEDELLGQP